MPKGKKNINIVCPFVENNIGPNSIKPSDVIKSYSGKTVENYEDISIDNKDRTIDSFIDWIKLKTGENNISKSEYILPFFSIYSSYNKYI